MENSFWGPVFASCVAGCATTVGGLVVFALKGAPSPRTISFFVSFAAGVMGVVSIVDLWLPSVRESFSAAVWATSCMLFGFGGSIALKKLDLPGAEQLLEPVLKLAASKHSESAMLPRPVSATLDSGIVEMWAGSSPTHRQRGVDAITAAGLGAADSEALPPGGGKGSRASTARLGALVCVALTAHNLPEGLGVMAAGTKSQHLGLVVAAALALHNVAEGFCVAVPIWAGTGSRWTALALTAASGLSEPVGALLGALVLRQWVAPAALDAVLNAVLCAVAGVMLFVASCELLPEALDLVRGDVAYVARCTVAGAALILAALMLI